MSSDLKRMHQLADSLEKEDRRAVIIQIWGSEIRDARLIVVAALRFYIANNSPAILCDGRQDGTDKAAVDQSLITRLSTYFHVNAEPENDLAHGYRRELDAIIASWGSPFASSQSAEDTPTPSILGEEQP